MAAADATPKQFLLLAGKPVLCRAVDAFAAHNEVTGIIVVCPAEFESKTQAVLKDYNCEKVISVVAGGDTRQASSFNGIKALACDADDIVLIHDAARPFVSETTITDCIVKTKFCGAAAAYVPVTDTVTEIRDGLVVAVLQRDNLFFAQTPQGFKYSIIRNAHELAIERGEYDATDDIALVLASGAKAAASGGAAENFKITTQQDYERACRIADNSK